MCGIIGYTGKKNAAEILLEGLRTLEYRGYDSAGISVFENNGVRTVKTAGRVSALAEKVNNQLHGNSNCGVGHTRWATHGAPVEKNAHPHTADCVTVVHNGIIENSNELKTLLGDTVYLSDTDTEVAAKIIMQKYSENKNCVQALAEAVKLFKGSYALGVIFHDIPDTVFAAKKDSPLLLASCEDGNFIASDVQAFLPYTDEYIIMEDGDVAVLTAETITVFSKDLNEKRPQKNFCGKNGTVTGKDGFEHYMLKEIHEEPEMMHKIFDHYTKDGLPDFTDIFSSDVLPQNIGTFHIVACGTALHAGLMGKHFIEKFARIPVNVQTAGEFRYCDPIIRENDVTVIISQSGETADSLAALRMVKEQKRKNISIVNTVGSTIAAETDKVVYTMAGAEIAVASTKAFSAQCEILFLFALKLALAENRLSAEVCRSILQNFQEVFTDSIPRILGSDQFSEPAKILSESRNAFFIGRGYDSHLGSEGSLKLKEISYIHSESYAASELKHGTISLIEQGTPVVAVASDKKFYSKILSNISEVKARGAVVISVCGDNAKEIINASDAVILLPDKNGYSVPFTASAALQLLAYHTAKELGRDIDKPRNLAKSVTVE